MTTPHSRLARAFLAPALLASAAFAAGTALSQDAATTEQRARWIAEMKADPRGPFAAIRWFCKDGRVLLPNDYSCSSEGQGWQHGEWSDRTKQLRSQGYKVATLLAGVDAQKAVAAPDFPDTFAQLLIEKFLLATDDGWVLRKARFYRGAIQEEDEREAARDLLAAMAAREEWIGYRFSALRIGVRLLPHGADAASAQKVRNMAAAIADRDPTFQRLRVKIHGTPEASDAASVREYGANLSDPGLRQQADALAAEIDRVYTPPPLGELLEANAKAFSTAPWLQSLLRDARDALARDTDPAHRYLVTANLLAGLRDSLPKVSPPATRLSVLDLSLAVEAENFRTAAALRKDAERAQRDAAVMLLSSGVQAAYGAGMINARERAELRKTFNRLAPDNVPLRDYLRELRYLGLAPGWATQQLRLQFDEAMQKLSEIEPLAALFIQDQLRGSPLLLYSQLLDVVSRDANHLAGVQHKLFGTDIGAGFNALNPGLARGILRAAPDMRHAEAFRPDGIYVLPETVADLPPLAGILTAGAGNALSHVQLLARNLGIPNVAVDESLLPALRRNDGKRIVLAVSPAGLVEINEDGPRWDAVFGSEEKPGQDLVFEPDLGKLDLSMRDFVSLDGLRAKDSGRIVGPKAAKLGELRSRFPDRVAPGVGIPFGVYRAAVLDRPYKNSGRTVYEWMVAGFRELEAMPAGSAEAGSVRGQAARRDLLDHRRHRPGSEIPRGAPRRDGQRVRPRLPRRCLRALGYQRRGSSRLHGRWPEPDALQCRGFREHREGDFRGLGLALCAACLGVATVPHERTRARLPSGVAPADGAVGHLRRDDHAGCRHGRSERAFRRGQRRRRGRGRRAGCGVGSNRPKDGGDAPPGNGHSCAPHGPAGNGRHRQAAGLRSRDPARAR